MFESRCGFVRPRRNVARDKPSGLSLSLAQDSRDGIQVASRSPNRTSSAAARPMGVTGRRWPPWRSCSPAAQVTPTAGVPPPKTLVSHAYCIWTFSSHVCESRSVTSAEPFGNVLELPATAVVVVGEQRQASSPPEAQQANMLAYCPERAREGTPPSSASAAAGGRDPRDGPARAGRGKRLSAVRHAQPTNTATRSTNQKAANDLMTYGAAMQNRSHAAQETHLCAPRQRPRGIAAMNAVCPQLDAHVERKKRQWNVALRQSRSSGARRGSRSRAGVRSRTQSPMAHRAVRLGSPSRRSHQTISAATSTIENAIAASTSGGHAQLHSQRRQRKRDGVCQRERAVTVRTSARVLRTMSIARARTASGVAEWGYCSMP